jgi:prevent-host-death family protein
MTITVNIGDADLTELLAKVEAGEDVILARNNRPVARLLPVVDQEERQKVIDEILEFRKNMPSVTQAEIAEWKAFGRR